MISEPSLKESEDEIICLLPPPPKIIIYKETFGDLVDITEQYYKENRE